MTRIHPLSGLMAFIGQGEWRTIFGRLLAEHIGPTLDTFGLTSESLIAILGKDRSATLWGCVLEDLMTRYSGSEYSNVVEEYLKRAGQTERVLHGPYMIAVRQSVMSVYEVIETGSNVGITVQDALRDMPPVKLHPEMRQRGIDAGDWIAARIIPDGDLHTITGGLLSLTLQSASNLLHELGSMTTEFMGGELSSMADFQLCHCTPIFTQAWLLENLPPSLDNPSAAGCN